MLEASAESKILLPNQETDYLIPVGLFKKVKTGDTVYTSSSSVNNGLLEPRVISEMKTEITNGVLSRSITFI